MLFRSTDNDDEGRPQGTGPPVSTPPPPTHTVVDRPPQLIRQPSRHHTTLTRRKRNATATTRHRNEQEGPQASTPANYTHLAILTTQLDTRNHKDGQRQRQAMTTDEPRPSDVNAGPTPPRPSPHGMWGPRHRTTTTLAPLPSSRDVGAHFHLPCSAEHRHGRGDRKSVV